VEISKVHLILVHGTWAPKAPWTDSNSSVLCQEITSQLKPIETVFHRADWTGNNNHRDRMNAAQNLIKLSQSLNLQNDEAVFLIGHSHGGAAIASALRESSDLLSRISGAVFMSTPFIHVAKRLSYNAIAKTISVLCFIFVLIAVLLFYTELNTLIEMPYVLEFGLSFPFILFVFYLHKIFNYRSPKDNWFKYIFKTKHSSHDYIRHFLYLLISFMPTVYVILLDYERYNLYAILVSCLIGLFAVVGVFYKLNSIGANQTKETEKEKSEIKAPFKRIDYLANKMIVETKFPKLTYDKALFIRSSEDEAANGLNFLTVLSWITSAFAEIVFRILSLYDKSKCIYFKSIFFKTGLLFQSTFGVLILFLTTPILISLLQTYSEINSATVYDMLHPQTNLIKESLIMQDWINLVWTIWFICGKFLIIAFIFILIIFLLANTLIGRAFGGKISINNVGLSFAIEPTPPGEWRVIQFKPSKVDEPNTKNIFELAKLSHSTVYQHPESVAIIANWIKRRLLEGKA
jgi:pimeloyl-ACP methyl ester carboxylesterase